MNRLRLAVVALAALVTVLATIGAALGDLDASALSRIYVGALAAALLVAGVKFTGGGDGGAAANVLALARAGTVLGAAEAAGFFGGALG